MQPKSDQFTEKAWESILLSQELARNKKHQQIETEHLFYELVNQDKLTAEILKSCLASITNIKQLLDDFINKHDVKFKLLEYFTNKTVSENKTYYKDIKEKNAKEN